MLLGFFQTLVVIQEGKKSVPSTTAILISGTSILSELGDANRQVNGQESLTLNELKHV